MTLKKAYVDIPEGQIHYRTEGSGDPIVLLHESPTSSITYSRVIPILAKRFRVIAMDTIGYGNSDALNRTYEVADYARTIRHFLDALALDQVCLVGHHTGCVLALETAVTWPDRVEKLVLSGLVIPTDPQKAEELQKAPRYRFGGMDEQGEFILNRWRNYRALCTPEYDLEGWYQIFVDIMRPGARTFDGHQAIFRHDTMARLPLIKCPTLVLHGTNDVVLGDPEKLRSLIPDVRTTIIKGGGVFVAFEMPEAFSGAILEFV